MICIGSAPVTLSPISGRLRVQLVRGQQKLVDVLKEYNAPTRQQRQWLLAAAYESDLGVVSHLETFDGTQPLTAGVVGTDELRLPDRNPQALRRSR